MCNKEFYVSDVRLKTLLAEKNYRIFNNAQHNNNGYSN